MGPIILISDKLVEHFRRGRGAKGTMRVVDPSWMVMKEWCLPSPRPHTVGGMIAKLVTLVTQG